MQGLRRRIIVVTGAASGIGAATVTALHEAGATVAAWDVTEPTGPHSSHDNDFHQVDVTDPVAVGRAVRATLTRHGRIDGLANVAGILPDPGTRLVDIDPELAVQTFAVNTHGVIHTMRAVVPSMVSAGGGAVVNVASESALHGRPGLGIYAASKAAVISLTRTAAREYGSAGLRVNAVCPGGTRTPMTDAVGPGATRGIDKIVPLGRLAEPEEIAAAIVFLFSDAASFVNGAVLVADGGLTA